jgi:hypothetical protein
MHPDFDTTDMAESQLICYPIEEEVEEDGGGSGLSRRRLFASVGGATAAGVALAGMPGIAVAEEQAFAAARKRAGLATTGRNAVELIGRINQEGRNLTAFGYLTEVNGLKQSQLFTVPRGTNFKDPNSISPKFARLTFFSQSTINQLSKAGRAITAHAGGNVNVHFLSAGGADFANPNSFAAGQQVASFEAAFQDNLSLEGGPGGGGGTANGRAGVFLVGDLKQTSSDRFESEGKKYNFGIKRLKIRLTAYGRGELLEENIPRSRIFIAGNLVIPGKKPKR